MRHSGETRDLGVGVFDLVRIGWVGWDGQDWTVLDLSWLDLT